jgi:hypothetical protein
MLYSAYSGNLRVKLLPGVTVDKIKCSSNCYCYDKYGEGFTYILKSLKIIQSESTVLKTDLINKLMRDRNTRLVSLLAQTTMATQCPRCSALQDLFLETHHGQVDERGNALRCKKDSTLFYCSDDDEFYGSDDDKSYVVDNGDLSVGNNDLRYANNCNSRFAAHNGISDACLEYHSLLPYNNSGLSYEDVDSFLDSCSAYRGYLPIWNRNSSLLDYLVCLDYLPYGNPDDFHYKNRTFSLGDNPDCLYYKYGSELPYGDNNYLLNGHLACDDRSY